MSRCMYMSIVIFCLVAADELQLEYSGCSSSSPIACRPCDYYDVPCEFARCHMRWNYRSEGKLYCCCSSPSCNKVLPKNGSYSYLLHQPSPHYRWITPPRQTSLSLPPTIPPPTNASTIHTTMTNDGESSWGVLPWALPLSSLLVLVIFIASIVIMYATCHYKSNPVAPMPGPAIRNVVPVAGPALLNVPPGALHNAPLQAPPIFLNILPPAGPVHLNALIGPGPAIQNIPGDFELDRIKHRQDELSLE